MCTSVPSIGVENIHQRMQHTQLECIHQKPIASSQHADLPCFKLRIVQLSSAPSIALELVAAALVRVPVLLAAVVPRSRMPKTLLLQRRGGHQPDEARQRPQQPAQRQPHRRKEQQRPPLGNRPQVDAPAPPTRMQRCFLQIGRHNGTSRMSSDEGVDLENSCGLPRQTYLPWAPRSWRRALAASQPFC